MTDTSTYDSGLPSGASEFVLRLWPRPTSCGQARHAIRTFCYAHALQDLVDDAELLTSELVTNAINHTDTLITVVAVCDEGDLIVNIRDDVGDNRPGAGPTVGIAATDAESGRGMHLVDRIAGRWGTTWHSDGKSVWFRLP